MCISALYNKSASRHSPFTPINSIETEFVLRSLSVNVSKSRNSRYFSLSSWAANAVGSLSITSSIFPFCPRIFCTRSWPFKSSYVRSLTLACTIVTYNVAIAAIISDLFVASSRAFFQQYRTFQIFPHTSKMSANIRQQCNGNLILPQIRIIYPDESIHLMIGINRHRNQGTYFLCF